MSDAVEAPDVQESELQAAEGQVEQAAEGQVEQAAEGQVEQVATEEARDPGPDPILEATREDDDGPRRYDFQRPAGMADDTRQRLERAFEEVCASTGGWLGGKLREPLRISIDRLEESRFGVLRRELPRPCSVFTLSVEGSTEPGAMQIDHELAFTILERSFGSQAEQIHVPERALSWIERVVLREVVEKSAEITCGAWAEHMPLTMTVSGFEAVPEMLPMSNQEATLVARLRIDGDGWTSYLTLALPGSAIAGAFARRREERPPVDPIVEAENRRRVESALKRASLPVSVRLPRFGVSLRDVSELELGTVLETALAADSEVEIYVSDELRFTGRVGRQGDHLAVEVLESIPPGAERPNPL